MGASRLLWRRLLAQTSGARPTRPPLRVLRPLGRVPTVARLTLPQRRLHLLLPPLDEEADLRALVGRGVLNLASVVKSDLLEILANFLLDDCSCSFARKILCCNEGRWSSVPPERSLVSRVRFLRLECLDRGLVLTVMVLVILMRLATT